MREMQIAECSHNKISTITIKYLYDGAGIFFYFWTDFVHIWALATAITRMITHRLHGLANWARTFTTG